MHQTQIHRRKEKNAQERKQPMPANHHYEKGNDKRHLFCTQFFRSSVGHELSAGDFYH
jgi:hypothetical protein